MKQGVLTNGRVRLLMHQCAPSLQAPRRSYCFACDLHAGSFLESLLIMCPLPLSPRRGVAGFRGFGRRKGERRRKSVRGCIVSQDLAVMNLVVVKQGAHSYAVTAAPGPFRPAPLRRLLRRPKKWR